MANTPITEYKRARDKARSFYKFRCAFLSTRPLVKELTLGEVPPVANGSTESAVRASISPIRGSIRSHKRSRKPPTHLGAFCISICLQKMLLISRSSREGIVCPVKGHDFHANWSVEGKVGRERDNAIRNGCIGNTTKAKMRNQRCRSREIRKKNDPQFEVIPLYQKYTHTYLVFFFGQSRCINIQ